MNKITTITSPLLLAAALLVPIAGLGAVHARRNDKPRKEASGQQGTSPVQSEPTHPTGKSTTNVVHFARNGTFRPIPRFTQTSTLKKVFKTECANGVNEASIIVSPTKPTPSSPSVDRFYSAFEPYETANPTYGITAATGAIGQPSSTITVENPGFDNIGDPVLASNPIDSGFHPYRVWLAGTTWNGSHRVNEPVHNDIHRQNQITIWHYDGDVPAASFVPLPGIDINTEIDQSGIARYFDDKPAIAVSQYSGTRGEVYVAYHKNHAGTPDRDANNRDLENIDYIQFCRIYGGPNGEDVLSGPFTVHTNSYVAQNPHIERDLRLDVDPKTGDVYLSWLDFKDYTIHVLKAAKDQLQVGGAWSSTSTQPPPTPETPPIPDAHFLKDGNICNGGACISAPTFLSTSLDPASKKLVFVYHRQAAHDGEQFGSAITLIDLDLPSFSFGGFKPVNGFAESETHDLWQPAIACETDHDGITPSKCLVAYYDHSSSYGPPDGVLRYKVYARMINADGIDPSQPDTVIYDVLSDPTAFLGKIMEYQSVFYQNKKWYTASVITEVPTNCPANPTTHLVSPRADVIVNRLSACELKITSQPHGPNVPLTGSQTFTLSVAATDADCGGSNGSGLTYQWYEGRSGDTDRPRGISSNTFTTPDALTSAYWVRITNAAGDSIDSETALVCGLPITRVHAVGRTPREQNVPPGSPIRLSVDLAYDETVSWSAQSATETHSEGTASSITVTPQFRTTYRATISSVCGAGDVKSILIDPCLKSMIVAQPVSASVLVGETASVSATATADGNPVYKWYQGEAGDVSHPIPDFNPNVQQPLCALGNRVTLTSPTITSARVWARIRAKNAPCEDPTDTDAVTLKIMLCAPPVLHGVAYGGETLPGEWVRFLVIADPPPTNTTYTYQWYRGSDRQPILDATMPTLDAFTNTFETYYCVVSTTCTDGSTVSTTSTPGYLWQRSVCDFPGVQISQSVNDVSDAPNNLVVFTAYDDWPGVTFQWYRGETGDTRITMTSDAGAPNRLTVSRPDQRPYPYWVRASIPCGAYHDSATVTFSKNGCTPILFADQPVSGTVAPGQSFTLFAAMPSVNPPVATYDWYQLGAGTPILLDSHSSSYVSSGITESTRYMVRVSNNCSSNEPAGTVDSRIATMRVECPLITGIHWPAGSADRKTGETATLQVTVDPPTSGTLTYSWYKGETGDKSIPVGNNTATLVTEPLSASATYWVWISNGLCNSDSPTIHVTLCVPPQIVPNALLHQAVYAGGSARLVQPFTGTNLTYQWYVGNTGDDTRPFGVSVDGIVVGGIYDTSKYWVKASNACDSRPSATFVVSVRQQITQQPVAAPDTIMPGQTTTLTAAGGTASATYAWYVGEQGDTSDALDAHSLTVTTPPVTATTKFWLRITSGDEHTDSDPVTVHLCDPPIVQWSAMNGSIASGTQFTLQLVPPAPGSVIDWYQGVSGDIAHSTHLYSTNVSYFQTTPLTQTTTYWARVTKGTCWSDSPTYSVNVCVPVIASNPASSMINGGASVTLSVAASPAALTYQWYTGAQGDTSHPISGATLASYTFSPSVTNSYWVRVAGTCGLSVDSTAATVTICQPPSIQSTAINGITGTSLSIAQGQAVTCSVIASGTNLTYQWYSGVNGNTSSPISGATAAQVTTSPQSAASYWVAITGTCGTFGGSTFTVSVCTTPVITTQPQSVTIFSGATATLSIAASEATSSAVTFQWYRGTSGDQSTPVGTGATFTTPALTSNTSYWVRASCGVCNPVNSQTATVSMCPIAANLPSPGDVSIALGQSATLATYSGAGNTYQWYFGASGNTSQTAPCASASCTFAPSVTTSYWCRVQNGTCVSSTPSGTISVCIPTITSHPQSIMINPSTSTTLTVAANTSGLTYQWYIGASGTTTSPIAGQTSSTLTISPSSATNYWVRVTGSCGQSVNSNTAAVTICQPPSISGPAPSQSIVRGQSTALLVTGSGTNMTYQWYIGPAGNVAGSVAIGTGTQSITVSPQDTTTYWARVTGTCGTANSTAGVVNVCASPVITSQPQSVSVFSGTTATLSVASSEATSTPVTYQWYRGSAGDTSAPAGTGASFVTPALTTPADYWVRLACGVCSPVDSQTATVSICPYPASLASPGTFNIALGQTAHLATVTGNSYTWYIGASGNTTQSFSVAPSIDVSPSTLTSYWCRVQNGTCVSSTATATVNPCVPTFTQHPASITIAPGSSTTLTSSANTAGVTYRWYTGATGNTASPVTNGTNATLTVTPGATTSYWVRATGSCGVTTDSTTATVTLCQPPAITAQPQNANGINAGYTTYLAVSATGSNLTYQWYYGDSGDTSSPVNGATGAAYSVPIYTTSKMWVRVSGQCGSVNSTMAWASVNPVITAQPQPSLTVGYNATATITIAVSGAYLHFAWKWDNGTPIAGAADSATLITPSITSYANLYCQVTSGAAIVTSYQTELRVCYDGPWINSLTKYPGYAYISAGNVYDYQWYQGARGDTSHPSQSGSPALVVSPPSATQYWCRVYSSSTGTGPTCYADSDVITMP